MIKSIAIYPHHLDDDYSKKVEITIDNAVKHGFNEVFTSIHLPEYSFYEQLQALDIIAYFASNKGLKIMVDIGGPFINKILGDVDVLKRMRRIPISFVRFDYGYDLEQMRDLYRELSFEGFVINASIYDQAEIDQQIRQLKKISTDIKIRACHNFYVREETGLDASFVRRQDVIFQRYEVPIYYCVPTHSHPRGPMYNGLCTIEEHRYASLRDIIIDLCLNYKASAILMADEWLEDDELTEVENTLKILDEPLDDIIQIPVKFYKGSTNTERQIVLKKHTFRYDSSNAILRSQSSRQMAEYASEISENIIDVRKAGDITVDNEGYKRYSGEMQVILKDKPKNNKVNVVAKIINPDDLIRLCRFRENIVYEFIEGDQQC